MPTRQSASGQALCPAGKVALGGGVLPDPEAAAKGGTPEDRMELVVSAPLLPGGDRGMSLVDLAMPHLRHMDPQRVRLIRLALQRMQLMQQEGAVLMMPELQLP